jgi:hypothetical protein
MLTLNNLQKLPHENHRKKPRFQTIVVQINTDFWVGLGAALALGFSALTSLFPVCEICGYRSLTA